MPYQVWIEIHMNCLSASFVKLNYIDVSAIVKTFLLLYQFDYPFLIVSWDLPSLARTFNAVYTASAHFLHLMSSQVLLSQQQ